MKALKTIFSSLLALLVLLSSISFTIDKHICMGRVQSVAILHDAAPCGMELFAQSGENLSMMEGCCKSEQTVIEGNEHLVKIVKPVAVEYQSLWVAELPKLIETIDLQEATLVASHTLYLPPLIDQDVPVLLQSFLI